MKKFVLGAVAGMSSLLLAVPVVVQIASAQSSSTSSVANTRATPTQACLQAKLALEDAHLANFDAESAKRKAELQKRRDTLATIAAITDDTERAEALKALHEELRTSMKDGAQQSNVPAAITSAMEAVRTACGDTMGFDKGMMRQGGMGMFNMGHGGKHGSFQKFGGVKPATTTGNQQ